MIDWWDRLPASPTQKLTPPMRAVRTHHRTVRFFLESMKTTRIILWLLLLTCLIGVVASHAGWIYPKSSTYGGGQALSLGKQFHVSLDHGAVVFYNNDDYGPYRGGMLSFVGSPNAPTVDGFGMWAGIYLRDINWPNGDRLWTLMISLWYPLVAIGAVVTFYELHQASKRKGARQNCCVQCGYSLNELVSNACPECGRQISDPQIRH